MTVYQARMLFTSNIGTKKTVLFPILDLIGQANSIFFYLLWILFQSSKLQRRKFTKRQLIISSRSHIHSHLVVSFPHTVILLTGKFFTF